MNRRDLLGLIAGLPFMGWLKPKPVQASLTVVAVGHGIDYEIATLFDDDGNQYIACGCLFPLQLFQRVLPSDFERITMLPVLPKFRTELVRSRCDLKGTWPVDGGKWLSIE